MQSMVFFCSIILHEDLLHLFSGWIGSKSVPVMGLPLQWRTGRFELVSCFAKIFINPS